MKGNLMSMLQQLLSGETIWLNTKAEREPLGVEEAHAAFVKANEANKLAYYDAIRDAWSAIVPEGKALDVFVSAKSGGTGCKLIEAAKIVKKVKVAKPAPDVSDFAAALKGAATEFPPTFVPAEKPACKPAKPAKK